MTDAIAPGEAWRNAGFLALNAGSSSLKFALFPAMGDTALLTASAERSRYVVDGGGEVLLIRIDPRR